MLYKSISPIDIGKLPMWKINSLIDDWLEDIERQKAEKKRQDEEFKKSQKHMNQGNYSNPKIPKSPKYKI